MSCGQTILDYGLRAVGIGERILPKADITLCEQAVLIGSGMLWNIYLSFFAVFLGFFAATLLALARLKGRGLRAKLADWFVFLFRGTPLFIQFFFAYFAFEQIPRLGFDLPLGFAVITVETSWLTKAWLGGLIVLFLNTSAYSSEIFFGAMQSVPKGEVEAAQAIGMSPRQRFVRVIWPTTLRLAWPSYTNEAIFLFHASALIFTSSFPAWQQKGDALYYANYMAEKTFNPFVSYPIVAAYFIIFTLFIIYSFSRINRRLNRHLAPEARSRLKFRPQWLR